VWVLYQKPHRRQRPLQIAVQLPFGTLVQPVADRIDAWVDPIRPPLGNPEQILGPDLAGGDQLAQSEPVELDIRMLVHCRKLAQPPALSSVAGGCCPESQGSAENGLRDGGS